MSALVVVVMASDWKDGTRLNVSRAMVMADMADNGTSKDVGTKEEEEDAAKFALSLAERGSGLDRKLVFQHSHRPSAA